MNDWRRAEKDKDRLDRIYMYMLQPDYFEPYISKYDKQYLGRLTEVHALFREYMSEYKVMKAMIRLFDWVSVPNRCKPYIQDCQRLFGDFQKRSAEFDRMILRERYFKIAERAKAAEDFDTERKCLDSIMKLDGLDKHGVGEEDPQQITIPAITFTTDPVALIEEAQIVGDEEE